MNKIFNTFLLVTPLFFLNIFLIIYLPPMNLEFSFTAANSYFQTNNDYDLESFFKYQANTLTMSYMGSKISSYLHIEASISQRALSLLGQIIILYSILLLKTKNFERLWQLLFLIFILPFIYIFSLRGTADLFPASLGILSYAIYTKYYLNSQKKIFLVTSSIIFSIAIIAKYHSLLYLIIFALTLEGGYLHRVKELIKFLILPVLIFTYFQILMYENFNFYFINPNFKNIHKFEPTLFLGNFLTCIGFMYLFINTLIVDKEFLKKLSNLKNFITSIFVFVISLIFIQNNGELNMPINIFSTIIIYKLMLSISAALGFMHIKFNLKDRYALFVLIGIALLSLSRPADRYLIFLFPFIYMVILKYDYKINFRYYLNIILFIFFNILILTKQYIHGTLCMDAINYLNKKEIIDETLPGDCLGSYGNLFSNNSKNKKYIIKKNIDEENNKKIFKKNKKIGILKQKISIENL